MKPQSYEVRLLENGKYSCYLYGMPIDGEYESESVAKEVLLECFVELVAMMHSSRYTGTTDVGCSNFYNN